jgi:hypothetical protein
MPSNSEKVIYSNQNAIRNQRLTPGLEERLVEAVSSVYGPGYSIEVYSGGQPKKGTSNARTGSIRHDEGRAADIKVYGPDGKQIKGDSLGPLAQYWQAKKYGGTGLEMHGGGIHLDEWTTPPPGGGMSWNYADKGGQFTPSQAAAVQAGQKGRMPAINGNLLAYDAAANRDRQSFNALMGVDYVPPPYGGQAQFRRLPGFHYPSETREAPIERRPLPNPEAEPGVVRNRRPLMDAWGLSKAPETPERGNELPDASVARESTLKTWGLRRKGEEPTAEPATAAEDGESWSPSAGVPAGDQKGFGTLTATNPGIMERIGNAAYDAAKAIGLPAQRMRSDVQALDSAARGVADVATFGLSDELAAAAGASTGIGGEYGSYEKNLDAQRAEDKMRGERDPKAYLGGQLIGGMLTAGMMAPKAAAATWLGRVKEGANVGSKFGAAYGFGSGEGGIENRSRSALAGAAGGAALGAGVPAIAGGLGVGVNKLTSAISAARPGNAASNNLMTAMGESGINPSVVSAEMARNPRLAPMDVDPVLQQTAMQLATKGGAPRSILNEAVASRAAGAKDAVEGAFDEAMGATPNVMAYLDTLKTTARENASRNFGAALGNAKPVDISPVLAAIDDRLAPGVQGVVNPGSSIPRGPVEQALATFRAKIASENEVLSDPQRLHRLQSELRIEADTLSKSASGQERLVGKALGDIRQKLVSAIDSATGGKYRPAQKAFADDMSIEDAFDKGRQVLSNATSSDAGLRNRPEYWQAWVKEASPAELDAAKLGARVAIDGQINSVRSAAAKGAALPEVGFNRERLTALLGKKETDRLASVLEDERKIAETNARLFAGSQTAPRQAVNELTKVSQVDSPMRLDLPVNVGFGFSAGGWPGAAAGAALSLGKRGVQYGMQRRDLARNELMARALSSPEEFKRIVTLPYDNMLTRTAKPKNRYITRAASGALVPQAAEAANQLTGR